jgi:hypothetical protein
MLKQEELEIKPRARFLFRAALLIAVSVCIAPIYLHFARMTYIETIDKCFDGFSDAMSPEQVSELLGIPLPTLVYLPDELNHGYKVTPYGWQDTGHESANCALRVAYGDDLQIIVYPSSRVANDDWSCGAANETPFEMDYQTACRTTRTSDEEGYSITISSVYPSQVIRLIAERLSLNSSFFSVPPFLRVNIAAS